MKPKKQGKSVPGNRKVQQNIQSVKKGARAKSLHGHSKAQPSAHSVKAQPKPVTREISSAESAPLAKKSFTEEHPYYSIVNQVVDPEVGVGVADMGIIYRVDGPGVGSKSAGAKKNAGSVLPKGTVKVTMTLTSMGCPAGPEITTDIDAILRAQPGVKDVEIEVVWDPPWNPDMMKPEVRAILFGAVE